MIFRSVYELAGCQKPMKRLWISSMEDSAIREGFEMCIRDSCGGGGKEVDTVWISYLKP